MPRTLPSRPGPAVTPAPKDAPEVVAAFGARGTQARSIVMLQPGAVAGLRREDAVTLIEEVQALQRRLEGLSSELRCLAEEGRGPEGIALLLVRARSSLAYSSSCSLVGRQVEGVSSR